MEYQALTTSMIYFSDKKMLLMKAENPYVTSVLRLGKIVFAILEEVM